MVKIIHAADFHLDSPLDGLPVEKASERREELRCVVSSIIDLANENEVDLILLAGDLFDGSNIYYETAQRLSCELARASARVFIAPGNHDFLGFSCPYKQVRWPDNVHIFKSPEIESVYIPELELFVHGAAFTEPYYDNSLLSGFSVSEPDKINIMVMHGDLLHKSRYNSLSEDDIAASGLDYLALGHNHAFSGVKKSGGVHFACPGCPEGRGFDEPGKKGIIIGALNKFTSDFAFIPVCSRRYEDIKVTLTAEADPIKAILEAAPPDKKLILRVTLEGTSDAFALDRAKLENMLCNYYYHLILRDRTHIRRGIWELRGEDTLKGIFLASMYEKHRDAGSDDEKRLIERAVVYGLGALDNREVPQIW